MSPTLMDWHLVGKRAWFDVVMVAALAGHEKIVEYFLNEKVNVNKQEWSMSLWLILVMREIPLLILLLVRIVVIFFVCWWITTVPWVWSITIIILLSTTVQNLESFASFLQGEFSRWLVIVEAKFQVWENQSLLTPASFPFNYLRLCFLSSWLDWM